MKWTYHTSHSYTTTGSNQLVSFMSTLYQCAGVYGTVNGTQVLLTPAAMVKLEQKLNISQQKGDIKDLAFGTEITVTKDGDELYKEVE